MKDAFLLVYRNIRERKTRSILTMLGVVVGIAAVIAIMSISYGMEESITEQLSEMADLIIVRPGKISFETGYLELGSFTDRDLEDVERIEGGKKAAGMVGGMQEVEYRGEKVMVKIAGTEPRDFGAVFGERIVKHEEGRDLRDNDRKVCEIGYSIAHDYFDYEIGVNDRLTINGSKFKVVGVLEEQGGFRSNVDSQMYVTKSDALDIFNTKDIATIFIRVKDIGEADEIATEIEERIDDNHKLDDFSTAMTMGSAVESLEDIFQMLQVFLVAIGSLSLIVASLGIMNTTLMSVMERTHEIGVMKAIGAKNRNILSLFLMEAGVVSGIGGVLGCVAGVFAAKVITIYIHAAFNVEIAPIVKPEVLLGGVVVAVLVGILSGFYPARKASKLSPVEAVRYE